VDSAVLENDCFGVVEMADGGVSHDAHSLVNELGGS